MSAHCCFTISLRRLLKKDSSFTDDFTGSAQHLKPCSLWQFKLCINLCACMQIVLPVQTCKLITRKLQTNCIKYLSIKQQYVVLFTEENNKKTFIKQVTCWTTASIYGLLCRNTLNEHKYSSSHMALNMNIYHKYIWSKMWQRIWQTDI